SIDYYLEKTNRRITFEYILIKDVNDKQEHAEELAELLKSIRHLAYVNLIPYNPVNEHVQYEKSTAEAIVGFEDILNDKGINCGVRLEQGSDIDAACGQLRSKKMTKKFSSLLNKTYLGVNVLVCFCYALSKKHMFYPASVSSGKSLFFNLSS